MVEAPTLGVPRGEDACASDTSVERTMRMNLQEMQLQGRRKVVNLISIEADNHAGAAEGETQ